MPELRKDPVIGRWVIVASERARRPGHFVDLQRNPFSDIQEDVFDNTGEHEVYVVPNDRLSSRSSWKIRVVTIESYLLSTSQPLKKQPRGLYETINGYGAHEIVYETPEKIANMADLEVAQIADALNTYAHRILDLKNDPGLYYTFVHKNYSIAVSNRQHWSNAQIIATPVIPLHIKEKLDGAKEYFKKTGCCIYTDMLNQELKAKSRIIIETGHFVAFTPFAARFPFEVMILPKKHNCHFTQGIKGVESDLAYVIKNVLLKFKIGLNDPAYTMVVNTSPYLRKKDGFDYWKTIEQDYCWHIEIMPRLTYVAGFEKGTGFYINSIPPEFTAEFLNKINVEQNV